MFHSETLVCAAPRETFSPKFATDTSDLTNASILQPRLNTTSSFSINEQLSPKAKLGRRHYGGTSKYRGVSWERARKSWRTSVSVNGKYEHVGYYTDEVRAAKEYDSRILELFAQNKINICGINDELKDSKGAKTKINTVKLNFPDALEAKTFIAALMQKRNSSQLPDPNRESDSRQGREEVAKKKLDIHQGSTEAKQVSAKQRRQTKHPVFKGVFWNEEIKSWEARIDTEKEMGIIGYYDSAKDAAVAYDKAAQEILGVMAVLNFPQESVSDAQSVQNPVFDAARNDKSPVCNVVSEVNKTDVTNAGDISGKKRERADSEPRASKKNKRAHGSSNFRGVSWFKANSVWKAQITVNGKYEYLGYYDNEEEAARAYDRRALDVLGVNAQLNFPIENYMDHAALASLTDTKTGPINASQQLLGGSPLLNRSDLQQHQMLNQMQFFSQQLPRILPTTQQQIPSINLWPNPVQHYFQHYQQRFGNEINQNADISSIGPPTTPYAFHMGNPFTLTMPQLMGAGLFDPGSRPRQFSDPTVFTNNTTISKSDSVKPDLREATPSAASNLMQLLGVTPVQLAQELNINLTHFLSWLENSSAPQNQHVGQLVEEWYQRNKEGVNGKLVDIRSRIKSLMLYIGVTQLQVAKELGLHASTVSEWFNGRKMHTKRIVQAGRIITRWIAEKLKQSKDQKLRDASESLLTDAHAAGIFDRSSDEEDESVTNAQN